MESEERRKWWQYRWNEIPDWAERPTPWAGWSRRHRGVLVALGLLISVLGAIKGEPGAVVVGLAPMAAAGVARDRSNGTSPDEAE